MYVVSTVRTSQRDINNRILINIYHVHTLFILSIKLRYIYSPVKYAKSRNLETFDIAP